MATVDNELSEVLKTKRICRFCLTQDEPLSNIYSNENRKNSRAPLPLQIMSCVSIEVFTNDGMPMTICGPCRNIMDYCYRFKQMCKKADTALKQYPLTGVWPAKYELPNYPDELLKPVKTVQPVKTAPVILNKRKIEATATGPIKKSKTENGTTILNIIPAEEDGEGRIIPALSPVPMPAPSKPRVLNQTVTRILNKRPIEHEIKFQSVTTDIDEEGSTVTEIYFEQPDVDPIPNSGPRIVEDVTNAEPVETDVFPCPHCARSFPLRQLLDLHMANHVRDRKFQCEICNKAFFSKYDLGKHLLIHSGEKPFQCVVCDKAFSRSTLLRRHEKVHSDQPKFLCVYCERPFLSKDELEKHTVNHLKNRPFVCSVCNKGFAFKQGLERHEVVHSTVQPFQCEHCDQSFSTQSKLARHLTAHAGARPYPCRVCPKSYLLSHHLTRHMRSHKELDISDTYKCQECSEAFDSRDGLIYHSAVHATESLMCPLCKEQFDDLDEVTDHIKSHTEGDQFACEFCESIFITEDKLRTHCDEKHADDLEAYDKDDRARESSLRSKQAETKGQREVKGKATSIAKGKKEPKVEVLGEFIISDAIVLDEHGENIVDKQLISSDQLIQFGEFENDEEDGIVFTLDENEIPHPIDVKKEKDPASTQRNIKSYFSPSVRKPAKIDKVTPEPQQTVSKSRPEGKSTPSVVRKLAVTSVKTSPAANKTTSPANKTIVKPVRVEIAAAATKSPNATGLAPGKKPGQIVRSTVQKQEGQPKVHRSVTRSSTGASPKVSASTSTVPAKSPAVEIKTTARLSKSPAEADKKKPESIHMKINDKMVKVQQVRMTKSQVAAMTKEGKIEMKGGQIILKK